MRKNKSRKSKVPILDEKSYTAYLEYLRNEGNAPPTSHPKKGDFLEENKREGTEGVGVS